MEISNIDLNEKQKISSKVGWVSIFTNTLLFVLKYWAGLTSGSIALIADAWHTLSDSITSVIILISGKYGNRPADEDHPYGHGRIEFVAAIIIGVFLAIVAFSFVQESINKLISGESANYGILAITVTGISIIVKEILARYAFKQGDKIGSLAIKADGWHHRTDALSSIVIMAGIFLNPFFWWMDALLGIMVALFLFYATYDILKSSIHPLLGTDPDKEILDKISKIVNEISGENSKPHHFHLHDYVNHSEITFHIKLDNNMSIVDAHEVATKIEEAIRLEMQIESTIHMEPNVKKNILKIPGKVKTGPCSEP